MKKFLSMALALVMTLSLVVVGASAKDFTDKSKITYGEAVDVISACKVIDGYTDGSFAPTNTLTRGAAAKIICNMMLGPTTASALGVSTAPFKDVSVKNVFAGYIAYCAKQGIINGYADKTFRPSGTVTGFQFLKMLLGALGYDSTIEGFTGSNWEVNVAKLAAGLGLYTGNDKFVGTNAMTREEACLYAYNTLTATMVDYETKGTAITINGVTIAQGASKAASVANKVFDYRETTASADTKANGTMQFCEQYFPTLTLDESTTDKLGNPTHTWTYGKTTVGEYANSSAIVTYTAAMDASVVKSDLKNYTYAADLKPLINNDAASAVISSYTGIYDLTANGTTVAVYANSSKVITKVVVTTTKAAKVVSVDTTKKTFTISYDSTTAVIDSDSDFYSLFGQVKKDDILAVTDDAAKTVLDLYVPKAVTGSVTYVKSNNKQATIGGTTVNAAATAGTLFAGITLGKDATAYLNKAGYAFDVEATLASTAKYIFVTNIYSKSDVYGSAVKYYAKGVLADGTVTTLQVASVTSGTTDATPYNMSATLDIGTAAGNAVATNSAVTPNTVYQYTENKTTSGLYLLTVPAVGSNAAAGVTAQQTSALTTNTSKITDAYMSSSVKFVYVSGTGDDVKASTGNKAAIAAGVKYYGVVEAVDSRNLVTVVFVNSSSVTSENSIFISAVMGNVQYKDAAGTTQVGKQVTYYANGSTTAQTMTIANTGTAAAVGFFTTSTDGEAYKLFTYGTDKNNKYTEQAVSSMYNGYATVDSKEFNLNNVTVIDTTGNKLDSVAALESQVNATKMEVKVAFTYDANNTVKTVYITGVASTDTAISSVTLNGVAATTESTAVDTHALTVAKSAALTLNVKLSNVNASYVVTYDNAAATAAGAFTNGVSTASATASTTGYFKIVVTAEDAVTATTYYVAFTTVA